MTTQSVTARPPAPVRSSEFEHLSLDALRDYRRALGQEESRVSYWRRILQARLDTVRADGAIGDVEYLRPMLTEERVAGGRTALIEIVPVDDIPPLPNLAELWDRTADSSSDEVARQTLIGELAQAETQLSAYRAALHRRLGSATGELIARYRENPALCLSALPLPAPRVAAGS
ncbi:MAG TPA: hypothetical protein VNA12_00770 [Mycobacteriales bacterium]|nr:hypothetical protein [Mycobacteriales bacterium]